MSEYEIRPITAADTHAVRRAVLHPTSDDVSTAWDTAASALHVGGFRHDTLLGVASIAPRRMPDTTETETWMLYDVAVDFGVRGWGLGTQLVDRCLEHAAVQRARIVWLDTPAGSFGFFDRMGFVRIGDPFTREGLPFYRMVARFDIG